MSFYYNTSTISSENILPTCYSCGFSSNEECLCQYCCKNNCYYCRENNTESPKEIKDLKIEFCNKCQNYFYEDLY